MAISTITVADTLEWVKRLSFGRDAGIGNNLQPALTNANIVMQTILSPPFKWQWNNQDVSFTASTTLKTATITNVALTSNVVTITAGNTFAVTDQVLISGVTNATFLNGQLLTILSASATQFTAAFTHANYVSAADTGTATGTTIQDYTVPMTDFGFIEYAAVYDINQTPSKWFELKVDNDLALDSSPKGRPAFICPFNEDANGNVKFRIMPAPGAAYPISVHVQNAPAELDSLNDTWAPIPDYMSNVYNWGMLTLQWVFADDPRAGWANAKFTSALLSRAEGLNEQERNIFLNNWRALTGLDQMEIQQGVQARSV